MTARPLRISVSTQGRLRRLNLITAFPPLILAAVIIVGADTHAWWHPVVLAPGVVVALVAVERWTANDLSRVFVPCLVVAAVVWPVGVLIGGPNAYWGVCVVASLAIPRLAHRVMAGAATLAFLAVVGAVRLLADPSAGAARWVLVPVGVTGLAIVFSVAGERFYDVVQELEQSRTREAELAVARERARFAGELHDIQGHTLHVVKLKTALAAKLVHSDPTRAEEELREIQGLVGDTIKQTKELAYAQRRLNLNAELENAKNLFEAAGIAVRITRSADAGATSSEMLGQVLRETTTNILRHAQATRVRITLTAAGISVVNDGARGDALPELHGLSALRRRVADDGGELTVAQKDGEFVTQAAFRS
ncbi:histidine kinase [Actinoplanes sp. NPDC048796]|uniref:sensor histidine kinase n=1 Tax=unclassified Actinoplanes TaxID=2626549 RepID=UPI0033F88001